MEQLCGICDKTLASDESVTVERGIDKLKAASGERNDGKISLFSDVQSIQVHVACRKDYTRQSSVNAFKRKRAIEDAAGSSGCSPPKSKMRSSAPSFDFKKLCIFCGNEADEEKEKKTRKELRKTIKHVSTIGFKETVMQITEKRKDAQTQAVKKRIIFETDLVAAEAKYHSNCFIHFLSPGTGKKTGRPVDGRIIAAMENIFAYIENNDDCQFTFTELKGVLEDFQPDDKTIRTKLQDRYGDRIVITSKSPEPSIVCFRDTHYNILNKTWYEQKKNNAEEERYRVLTAAAAILRQDIRSVPCETDYYPPSTRMFDDVNSSVPKSLRFFIEEIIMKNRKGKLEPLEKKCTTISHAIMSAVRPRSFLSPLQIGLSVYLHRQFASKRLVEILSCLGLCASYKETVLYESSSVFHPEPLISPPEDGCFIQHVCDNADHNVSTLDGANTFHSMGIIRIVTPHDTIHDSQQISRLRTMPTAAEMATVAKVSMQIYENSGVQGLKKITVEKLDCDEVTTKSVLRNTDVLWLYGKWKDLPKIPGWSGFMEYLTKNEAYSKSRIVFLPFINAPASDYNTIYTSLKSILNDGQKHGHTTCVVTFDQPLYLKAREIVAASHGDTQVSKIIVRLGGFHLLMSFLASIGYIMAGSGLKEVISTVYASNSVDKMLQGHAYARAIRAHTLLQTALSQIVFNEITFDDDQSALVKLCLQNSDEASSSFDEIESSSAVGKLKKAFDNKMSELENKGPTAKLWVQYFEMVTIAKEFIRAERLGCWKAHLTAIKKMLPYFHAAGHFLYAKSAHLYIQDMQKLEMCMEKEAFKKFTNNFFSIKRSDKYFCGTWSDMIIEQHLMKSSKSRGGFTHGRSTKESVLSKWIFGLLAASNISEGLESFCKLSFDTGEQHVDARDSRVNRDREDVQKILQWFQSHHPFPDIQQIMSIATGISGDEKINCHNAQKIGTTVMEKKIGQNFKDIKSSRADRVLSLLTVNSNVKVRDKTVPIDPLLLFQRISAMKRSDGELRIYMRYELAPFPLSMFIEGSLRIGKKSALFDVFKLSVAELDFTKVTYVIDGGFLLHRVVWHQNESFDLICSKYIGYVQKYYGSNAVIVFDGYNNSTNSVKAMEQRRRAAKSSSADTYFDETMNVTVSQEKFLSNSNNKRRLISMLSVKFEANNFVVKHAQDDADVLIIETALECSRTNRTVVVGEDVDLLVILVARSPIDEEIFFLKPGKGKVERKLYSSRSFNDHEDIRDHLLLLHAFTGCDTTSALFHKGKTAALKLLAKRQDLRAAAQIFNQSDASRESISSDGIRIFLAVYGAPVKQDNLNAYRYLCFMKAIGRNKSVNLSLLPPTADAAKEHLYRVYYQVQYWLGNQLNPQDWGWVLKNGILEPVKTSQPPAPERLLNMIFCNCSKGCGALCGCRKLGLQCSAVCGNCRGTSCLNAAPIEDSIEKGNDIDDPETDSIDDSEQSWNFPPVPWENREQFEKEEEETERE